MSSGHNSSCFSPSLLLLLLLTLTLPFLGDLVLFDFSSQFIANPSPRSFWTEMPPFGG
ncbi:hypothetical protein GUITHDRAFT_150368 [Guillardia theta CCMP2712]|uniref:Uncharacterized protein n=1 Tax=Guillardia theta (strain CCMP2712) TaxID=905079 RepID=L1JYY8_GUITC|nr:hypothetical protein GUITHDRAFT_150368 [Guillardia theta CCMP2712]EKX53293.1 hypothetical protein GUITHDRAFT_150368 [Guillardia theta CCMP2712]|eukprot:XP_005840273.1 hypothetical protein GUITHDRAFT_150368 [Guillardia theta CCMP2712]